MAEKRPLGRPTKLTPETIERYCDALRIGSTHAMAAAYAGVDQRRTRVWLERAEEAAEKEEAGEKLTALERLAIDFAEAVHLARMAAQMKWQMVVDAAASEDPAWAWKMLRLRDPENYREANEGQVNATVNLAGGVTIYLPGNGRDNAATEEPNGAG